MTATQAHRDFRPDLEGVRAIAILAVVAYHADLVAGGFVGVDVFFVVSGFLITRLLWAEVEQTGKVALLPFYARRARRLLPASMFVLVVTLAASVLVLPPLRARTVVTDTLAASLYGANYRFAAVGTDYLADQAASPVQHYWSLAVEEQFYLVWPALILLAARSVRRGGRRRRRTAVVLALVGIGSFAACVWLTEASQPWAFFSLPTRAWELAAGGLVALAEPRLRAVPRLAAMALGWGGLLAVAVSVSALDTATAFPGAAAALPVLGAAAVLAAGSARPGHGVAHLLSRPPLQAVGRLSYAWYLWHWPVVVLAEAAVGHRPPPWALAALVAASALPAAATVALVERPIRFSPMLVASTRRSLGFGAAATALAVLATAGATAQLPSLAGSPAGRPGAALPPPEDATDPAAQGEAEGEPTVSAAVRSVTGAVAAGVDTAALPADLDPPLVHAKADKALPFRNGCNNAYKDDAVHPCTTGDPSAATTVVLFGDSHAAQWFPPLELLARQRGWRLVTLTKAVCPPVDLSVWSPVLRRSFRECDAWRRAALDRIRAERPALVVFGAARHYGPEYRFHMYGPDWLDGLRRMVGEVRATGARVAVLGPMPRFDVNVPDCISEHTGDVRACRRPLEATVDVRGAAEERSAAEGAGATYVDIHPWTCTPTTCAVVVGNLLVYRDDNHVTTPYASWLAPVFGEALANTLAPAAAAGGP